MGKKSSNGSRYADYRAITYPGYLHLPQVLTAEDDFISLSGSALKLLIDVARQYNGSNNGDLCMAMTLMKVRGWNSNNLLSKAKQELISKNWITKTKQGGMGIGADLFAITWQPINHCGGKLDVPSTTLPPRKFKRLPEKNHSN
jgi:hypothetical protein